MVNVNRNNWKVTTQPTAEALTLNGVKNFLKVDSTADDTLILSLIAAARQSVERYCSIGLLTQTITEYFDYFPKGDVIELSVYPLRSVTSVKYTDASAQKTLSTDVYGVDASAIPAYVYLKENQVWPEVKTQRAVIEVIYTVGFDSAATSGGSSYLFMQEFLSQAGDDLVITENNGVLPSTDQDAMVKVYQNGQRLLTSQYTIAGSTITIDVLTHISGANYQVDFIADPYNDGVTNSVPEPLKQAMLLIIAEWYNNRQDSARRYPQASQYLLEQYRKFLF